MNQATWVLGAGDQVEVGLAKRWGHLERFALDYRPLPLSGEAQQIFEGLLFSIRVFEPCSEEEAPPAVPEEAEQSPMDAVQLGQELVAGRPSQDLARLEAAVAALAGRRT